MSSDRGIIESALSSSRQREVEFSRIYEENKRLIAFVASAYFKEDADVEDVVSETFLRFFLHAEEVDVIRPWLCLTAKRICLDKKRKQDPDFVEDMDVLAGNANEQSGLRFREIVDSLHEALNGEEVEIVLLHGAYGVSFSAIAKANQGKESTYRSTYHRAMSKYRAYLKKHKHEESH